MSAASSLDLTTAEHPWRSVPMPGSNGGIDLVRLASPDQTFTILGRFAPGFERATAGGYLCSEEFLVLDGELELEGRTYVRGDLTVVPEGFVRTSMRAAQGCLLLAWFGGPATFREPSELDAASGAEIESVSITAAEGDLLSSVVGSWSTLPSEGVVEAIGTDLRWWWRGDVARVPPEAALFRRERHR